MPAIYAQGWRKKEISAESPQLELDKEIINHGFTRINTDLKTCISFTHWVNCRFLCNGLAFVSICVHPWLNCGF
jgi:hypothetical protein